MENNKPTSACKGFKLDTTGSEVRVAMDLGNEWRAFAPSVSRFTEGVPSLKMDEETGVMSFSRKDAIEILDSRVNGKGANSDALVDRNDWSKMVAHLTAGSYDLIAR